MFPLSLNTGGGHLARFHERTGRKMSSFRSTEDMGSLSTPLTSVSNPSNTDKLTDILAFHTRVVDENVVPLITSSRTLHGLGYPSHNAVPNIQRRSVVRANNRTADGLF